MKDKSYEYECSCCGQPQTEMSGQVRAVCSECVHIRTRRLNDKQYVKWLELQASRIDGGLPLIFWDDTTEGAKATYCSWGMCNDDLGAWPWIDTWKHPKYTKPIGEASKKTISHIGPDDEHWCPFDQPDLRDEHSYASFGCFRRCAIFQAGRLAHLPTKTCSVVMSHTTLSSFRDCLAEGL